jgi:hypothetical protein
VIPPALLSLGRAARRRAVAAVLGLTAFVSVLAAQRGEGIVRDEVVYMDAGSRYASWWLDVATFTGGTVTEAKITATFGGPPAKASNSEHPPLMKMLYGLSERVFHDGLGWTSEVTGYRLPAALMFGVLVALVALFAARVWGLAEGALAGALVLLMPRLLFHAGLAAFDGPMVTMWFATVYAYYRSLSNRWWCIGLAVAFGCALATKHNALMIPVALVVHYAWVAWRRERHVRGLWTVQPWIGAALFAGGPVVLFILWPWLWFDTFAHLETWIAFHLSHVHYNFEYLGHNWNAPPFPWHIAIVTTLFTVPVATLVAGVIGCVELVNRARAGEAADADRAPALLLFLSAGVAMGPFLLTSTPIFGAEKHWSSAMPTIAVFAAIGALAAARRAAAVLFDGDARARARTAVVAGVAVAVGAAAMVQTVDAQPYALSHYNALAGGAPGGADLGMNRQFWGYAARGVLPWIAEHAPDGNVGVYTHDAQPAWGKYKGLGLREDRLRDTGKEMPGIAASRIAIVIHELHFNRHDYMIWRAYGTVQPAFVLTTDGVPIVSVYVRR